MYELPNLVIELISEYLSYNDLLNLRSTCKQLKQFIDQKEFKRLYLFVGQNPSYYDLFYTNDSICYPNSFRVGNLLIFESLKFKNNFNQLQKLCIVGYKNKTCVARYLNLNVLNHLTQLLHLEIKNVSKIEGKLSLKNLKIVYFGTYSRNIFELDCPDLIALKLGLLSKHILIGETKNLKYLWIDLSKDQEKNYLLDILSNTQNLSSICFSECTWLTYFLKRFNRQIINLRGLKRIEMNGCFFDEYGFKIYHVSEFHDLMSSLSVFFKNTSTKHIKFFINHHNQLTSLKELESIIDELRLNGYFNNNFRELFYDKIKSSFEKSTAFEWLLQEIFSLKLKNSVELDEKIIKKMKNLGRIYFGCKLEKTTYQQILTMCPRLVELNFEEELNFELSELDKLPKHLPYLKTLSFSKDLELDNFDFICKLKNLEVLVLPQIQLKKEVLIYILDNCSDMKKICIKGKYQNMRITIKWTNLLPLLFYNGINCFERDSKKSKLYKFDTLNSLIDFYYENNLFESEFNESLEI